MGYFFLNPPKQQLSQVPENFPYNIAPTAWLANCYNGFKNKYLRYKTQAEFKRQCFRLLNAVDLVKELESMPLETERFKYVSCLGTGATSKVELVKDIKKDKRFAMKIFALKEIIGSSDNCSSYVNIKIYHKLRGTNAYDRWHMKIVLTDRGDVGDTNDNFTEEEMSPSECATRFLSSVISQQITALKNEIDILLSLRKAPYIIEFYGSYVDIRKKNIFLCTQFCDTSLEYILKRCKVFDAEQLQAVAASILLGLHEINKIGYIHLDIKPENVLVSKDGTIRICDFGSAVKIGHTPQASTLGTARYYSPELHFALYNGEGFLHGGYYHVDGITGMKDFFESEQKVIKCDIWAFGITMLTLSVGMDVVNSLIREDEKDFILGLIFHMHRTNASDSLLAPGYLNGHDDENELARSIGAGKKLLSGLKKVYLQNAVGKKFPDFLKRALIFNRSDRPSVNELLGSDFINGEIDVVELENDQGRSRGHTKAWKQISDMLSKEYDKP